MKIIEKLVGIVELHKITVEITLVNGEKYSKTFSGSIDMDGSYFHIHHAIDDIKYITSGDEMLCTNCNRYINPHYVVEAVIKKQTKRIYRLIKVTKKGWFSTNIYYKKELVRQKVR